MKILGDPEVHVNSGSPVSIRCLVSSILDMPSYVFWYRGTERVMHDKERGINITTYKVYKDTVRKEREKLETIVTVMYSYLFLSRPPFPSSQSGTLRLEWTKETTLASRQASVQHLSDYTSLKVNLLNCDVNT